jgi:hypothetical protein
MSVEARSRPDTHADPRGRRLESWKEIAAYLGRDVTTARRWEKQERLPVYRLQHSSRRGFGKRVAGSLWVELFSLGCLQAPISLPAAAL